MKVTTYSALLVDSDALTLAAATETDVVSQDNTSPDSNGIDVSQADNFSLVLSNTGSHDIQTVTVYKSPLGTNYVAVDQNFGPVVAGSAISIDDNELLCSRLRVTATSSAGTTLEVEMIVNRWQL